MKLDEESFDDEKSEEHDELACQAPESLAYEDCQVCSIEHARSSEHETLKSGADYEKIEQQKSEERQERLESE